MGAGVRPWIGFYISISEEIPHSPTFLLSSALALDVLGGCGSYGRSMRRGVDLGSPTFLLSLGVWGLRL